MPDLLQSLARPVLIPASWLYGAVTRVRNLLYDRKFLSTSTALLPVISIGNLTVGGTGKSPVAQLVAQIFLESGFTPVILSRGYGGMELGPHLVTGAESVSTVGDEALMHNHHFRGAVPVVISRRRASGAKFIAEQKLGNVIILDDGFQHRALNRDLNCVVFDVSLSSLKEQLETACLLPLGRFREDPQRALKRADAIILTRRWDGRERARGVEALPSIENIPQIEIELAPAGVKDLVSGEALPLMSLKGQAVRIFSTIASTSGFERMLYGLGAQVTDRVLLGDHAEVTKDIWDRFANSGSALTVMTEKDAVKVTSFISPNFRGVVLQLAGQFSNQESIDNFQSLVALRLQKRISVQCDAQTRIQ